MEYTAQGLELQEAVKSFMDDFIYPNEEEYYEQQAELDNVHDTPSVMEKLKAAARERGLWSLFIPHLDPQAPGTKLPNLDYSPISELLGKVPFSSEALNCSAPDTGNMEILNLYASERVKERWLAPLLQGDIRSAFSMTEPDVASSDASN
ncbi:MAG: acyl-CoA dehydrogenase, partial [Actinomycetia bacterium]|nr:acyl-CoA dehydrogenase [Actinomycetes bacterium]